MLEGDMKDLVELEIRELLESMDFLKIYLLLRFSKTSFI